MRESIAENGAGEGRNTSEQNDLVLNDYMCRYVYALPPNGQYNNSL